MLSYLALAGVVLGANLLPAFGPPTWTIMVFFRLQSGIPAVPLVLIGAVFATLGRVILAFGSRRVRPRLSAERIENLEAARELLAGGRRRRLAGLALFVVSPLPSAQLFEAVGVMGIALAPVAAVFLVGRIVTYSLYVAAATAAQHSFGSALTHGFTSPWGIALQVAMLFGVVALVRVDWVKLLRRYGGAAATGRIALMKRHVVILGAGFAGLELATRLSETLADEVRVTLIDRNDSFYFGFSKLDVMLGRRSAESVRMPYSRINKRSVEFRQETVVSIDPVARRVETDHGVHEADFLVIAMGAEYDLAATPGFAEGGYEYYSLAGAERLHGALTRFDGGRVLLAVLGQPFKCPPAPFEGAFLLHEYFVERGIRDRVELSVAFPMKRPVPVTAEVSQMFRDGLEARGIIEHPETLVKSLDAGTACLASGEELEIDLFVGVPVHRAPQVLTDSGLTEGGWVPVDQANLRTNFPNVYALGDVCSGPRTVAKAGIFAERAAGVVAADIAADLDGGHAPAAFQGEGVCYAEFGGGLVAKVEVNFLGGEAPAADRNDPSTAYAAEKADFGATRRARWFGL